MLSRLFNNRFITVKHIFTAFMAVMLIALMPITSQAADMSVSFGANRYAKASGTQFEVSVYLKSDLGITDYSVEIQYDRSRLKCISGAAFVDEAEGVITCEGSEDYVLNVKEWLEFEALSGGQADLSIISAKATDAEGNEVIIENLGATVISLTGADISEEVLSNLELELAQAETDGVKSEDADGAEAMTADEAAQENDNAAGDNSVIEEGESDGTDSIVVELPVATDGTEAADSGVDASADTSLNRKAVLYWVIVAGIMLFLVGIVVITSFAGRKDEKARKNKGSRQNDQIEMVEIDYDLDPDNELLSSVEDEEDGGENDEDNADENDEDDAVEDIADDAEAEEEAESEKTVVLKDSEEADSEKTVVFKASEEADSEKSVVLKASEETDSEVKSEAESEEKAKSEAEPKEKAERPSGNPATRKPLGNKEPLFIAQKIIVSRKIPTNVPNSAGEFIAGKVNERHTYEYSNVLDELSVSLFRGEIIELVSKDRREIDEFIKVVTGVRMITSGTITMKPEHCHVVTARSGFAPELTVRANIYRNGALMGYSKAMIDKCYGRIAGFAAAENLMEEPAGSLPATVLSKLEIALALIDDKAELLVLDNVLGECDKEFAVKCSDILRKMARKKVVVLLNGNIPEEIAVNCNRTIHLENGRVRKGRV